MTGWDVSRHGGRQKNCSCSGRQVGRHGSQHGGQTKNILADMEFDIVADKEVAKVAGHGG